MTRRKYVIAGLVVLALLIAGAGVAWYYLSPAWALRSMVAAAKANDEPTLSSYIDYPALKADLKKDLSARFEAESKKTDDPTAKMGVAIARSMMDGVINAFVSPAGLRATLVTFDESDVPPAMKKNAGKPKIERLGFNRFRLSREENPGSGFVFERRGLGWKMVGVDLSAQPAPARPIPAPGA